VVEKPFGAFFVVGNDQHDRAGGDFLEVEELGPFLVVL
jgi:hypothetical protein